MAAKIHHYETDDIDVQYDVKRCIHAAECVRGLPAVFDSSKRPWIQPANAEPNAIAEVIGRCPTGALHFTRKDGGAPEPTPAQNRARVQADGPIYVRGQIELTREDGTVVMQETRVALCRCGASKNKPFCDNSHKDIAFQDAGLVRADAGAPAEPDSASGTLSITPTENGPVHAAGPLLLQDAAGQTTAHADVYLCRCGASKNKPFCDGSHHGIHFTAPQMGE